MQILRDVKHFIKDYRGETGTAEAGAAEPMARLLVQVQLPQKGPAQPPALPSAIKQQASSPRTAVAVSCSSSQKCFWSCQLRCFGKDSNFLENRPGSGKHAQQPSP